MNSINDYINVHTPARGKKFGTWQNLQSKHRDVHRFLTLKRPIDCQSKLLDCARADPTNHFARVSIFN